MAGLAAHAERLAAAPGYRWWVLGVVQFGNLLAALDSTIVTLALPAIARDLRVGLGTAGWVAVAYLVTTAVALLVAGRVSDLVGRRRVFVAGLAVFTGASALCAAAPDDLTLIACRVVQALGAACLLANTNAITAAIFPPTERGRALGVNSTALGLGYALGLTLGGLLIGAFGWRSVFLINLPIGLVALSLALLVLSERAVSPARRTFRGFDTAGALLSALGLGALVLGCQRMAIDRRIDPADVGLFAGGVVALGLFLLVERRARSPLLDLELFRAPSFRVGVVTSVLFYAATQAFNVVLPFYGQLVLGLSAAATGLLITPYSVVVVVVSPFAGALADRFGADRLTTAGMLCAALAVFWLGAAGADPSVLAALLPGFLLGAAGGLFGPTNTHSALDAAPPDEASVAAALLNATRFVGWAVGASLAATLLDAALHPEGGLAHLLHRTTPAEHAALVAGLLAGQALTFHVVGLGLLAGAVLCALVRACRLGHAGRDAAA